MVVGVWVVVGWLWGGCGVVVGWLWGGCGVVVGGVWGVVGAWVRGRVGAGVGVGGVGWWMLAWFPFACIYASACTITLHKLSCCVCVTARSFKGSSFCGSLVLASASQTRA